MTLHPKCPTTFLNVYGFACFGFLVFDVLYRVGGVCELIDELFVFPIYSGTVASNPTSTQFETTLKPPPTPFSFS